MKKLILIFLLLSLNGCYFHLREADAIVMVRGGGGASCITEVDSDVTGTTLVKAGSDAVYKAAGSWTASSSYCLCKITLSLKINGAPSGTLSVKIYDTSVNLPNTVLATATETKTAGTLTTSFVDYAFNFSSCANLTSGQVYWVSIESDTLNSSIVYFATQRNGVGVNKHAIWESGWVSSDSSAEFYRVPFSQ